MQLHICSVNIRVICICSLWATRGCRMADAELQNTVSESHPECRCPPTSILITLETRWFQAHPLHRQKIKDCSVRLKWSKSTLDEICWLNSSKEPTNQSPLNKLHTVIRHRTFIWLAFFQLEQSFLRKVWSFTTAKDFFTLKHKGSDNSLRSGKTQSPYNTVGKSAHLCVLILHLHGVVAVWHLN